MTKTKPAPTKKAKAAKAAKKSEYLQLVAGQPLHGWIVCWEAGGPHPHATVVAALTAAGLDPDLARVLSAKSAWLRATRKLSDKRVVEQWKQDGDKLYFQFTKASIEAEGIDYKKEATVVLDTQLGKITCKVPAIQDLAQAKLDECLDARTTSDISKIITSIFETNSDLIPVRSQGGAYFVPVAQEELVMKVGAFLAALNGKLNPWPIAKGVPSGDQVVAASVTDHLKGLVAAYRKDVSEFTLATRASTVEQKAEAIKLTRAKLEAYAEYLGSLRDEVAGELDTADAELLAKVKGLGEQKQQLAEQKAALPPGEKGPSTKELVYRQWLAAKGKPDIDAIAAGVGSAVKASTIRSWTQAWAKGKALPACATAGTNGTAPKH